MEKISFIKAAEGIKEYWKQLEVARVNQTAIKIAKLLGQFQWHKHSKEDEFFLVLEGKMGIETKKAKIELGPGEGFLIKRGTLHRTSAQEEATVILIEPVTTVREGD